MTTKRRIELFRTGDHTDSAGKKFSFTPDIVRAMAKNYDRVKAPAPVVIGHPGADAPAYGWADSLDFDEATGKLFAELDCHDAMAAAIDGKHYNRTSAALFAPDHSANPTPGAFSLRHVGMLGGAAPAIPGLAPFGFADAEKPGGVFTLEFATHVDKADDEPKTVAELLKSLPGIIREAFTARDSTISFDPAFAASATTKEPDAMTPEQKADFDRLTSENAALKLAATNAAKTTATATATAFAAEMVTARKINPAQAPAVVATLTALLPLAEVEFGADGGKKSAADLFRETIRAGADVLVTDTKIPADTRSRVGIVAGSNFTAPAGVDVDEDADKLHAAAMKLRAANPAMTYAAAIEQAQASA